jgi:hypothetical protein
MRLFIGIVTCERPKLLEFMLRYMHMGVAPVVRSRCEVHIFENCEEPVAPKVLESVARDIRPMGYTMLQHNRLHPRDVESMNSELGAARRELVRQFMMHEEYTHCVILDDDLVVSLQTIWHAAQDLNTLRDMGVASLTLHPFKKRLGALRYSFGDKVFINHDFTGDYAWIIPRSTLLQWGNVFSADYGGYANTFWAKMLRCRMTSVTRLHPCYEIQHLGVSDLEGSIIYKKTKQKPAWTIRLLQDYTTKRILHSDIAMLWSSKGPDALLEYVRRESQMTKQSESTSRAKDKMPMPRGRVEIDVENLSSGEKKTVKIDNLVVDNAKNIMAHLLGGEAVADWAIGKMVFGTGTTAPTESDSGLEIPLTPEKSVTVDYPDTSSVRFTGVLESDEANGFPIAEAGLYTASEGMFARIVFGPLSKSADFRFVFRWTIYW